MNLLLIALFAAFRQPGSTLLAVLVMACLLYLGVAAIFVPDNPGSWGLLGGAIAISGGAAYMTMVTCAERLRDSIRGPFYSAHPVNFYPVAGGASRRQARRESARGWMSYAKATTRIRTSMRGVIAVAAGVSRSMSSAESPPISQDAASQAA